MAAVELEVLVAGHIPMPDAYVFRPRGLTGGLTAVPGLVGLGGERVRAPLLAFALRHPTAGSILIDTGLHPDVSESTRRDYGPLLSLVLRGLKPADEPFDRQLRGIGIDPAEVELTVMTHLHLDHTSGMRLLPRAEFVCSQKEWKAATGRAAVRGGYVSGHLPPESRMRLLDIEREGEPHGPFSRTADLLGDGAIRLVSTPGHTPGHLSVLVRLAEGREALLIADAVYTLRNLYEERLPLITIDDEAYLRSLREIKAYAEQRPDATLVPTHDPDAWRALRGAEMEVGAGTER
jgi:N-acyl homoserine lactone hydrolase